MNCQYLQIWVLYILGIWVNLGGNRVVISKELRQKVAQLAHHGHQGLVKTKQQLLREKVWFPEIDNLVTISVEHCLPCQSVHM